MNILEINNIIILFGILATMIYMIFDIRKSINGIIKLKKNQKRLKQAYKNKEWEKIAKYSRFKRYGVIDMIIFRQYKLKLNKV